MKRSGSELELEEGHVLKRRKLNEKDSADQDLPLLPKETWLHIISGRNIMLINSIDFKNIFNFREVNKYFRDLIDESEELSWATLYFSNFGGFTDQVKYSTSSWKKIYLDAQSRLIKIIVDHFNDWFEENKAEAQSLLAQDDNITKEKAESDYDEAFSVVYKKGFSDHEVYDALAEFISKYRHCSLAPAYYSSEKVHHMEVFHLLFEEKYYRTWQNYNEESDFDQMDVVGLLYDDFIGTDGEYKIENIPRALEMARMDDNLCSNLDAYWEQQGEALRIELENKGREDLVESIERIIKAFNGDDTL